MPVFRPRIPSTRFQFSVKVIRATINLDGIGAEDLKGNVIGNVAVVARTIDMMLY